MAYEGPGFVQPVNMREMRGGERAIYGRDDNLHVEFYKESVLNTFKTAAEGRPIYETQDMVYIHAPGNKSDLRRRVRLISEPNAPSDAERFPRQWQAFKNQEEQVSDGMPVERAPFIQPHRALELKALKIYTVEQLAMLPDSIMQTIGMDGRKLRDLSRAFLDDATRLADLSAKEAENSKLRAELDAMKQQLADLAALRDQRSAA